MKKNTGKSLIYKSVITVIVMVIAVTTFLSCNGKSKGLTPKWRVANEMVDAYNKHEWETVASKGDSAKSLDFDFMSEKNSAYTLCYAEGLAAIGRDREAIKMLNIYLDRFPDNYYIAQSLGNVYYGKNNKAAHRYYELTFKINPTYARPYIKNAELYELEKDYENAIDNYLNAVSLFAYNDAYAEIVEFSGKILDMPIELEYNSERICIILKAYGYKKLGSDSMYNTIKNKMWREEVATLDSVCNLGWKKYVEIQTANEKPQ